MKNYHPLLLTFAFSSIVTIQAMEHHGTKKIVLHPSIYNTLSAESQRQLEQKTSYKPKKSEPAYCIMPYEEEEQSLEKLKADWTFRITAQELDEALKEHRRSFAIFASLKNQLESTNAIIEHIRKKQFPSNLFDEQGLGFLTTSASDIKKLHNPLLSITSQRNNLSTNLDSLIQVLKNVRQEPCPKHFDQLLQYYHHIFTNQPFEFSALKTSLEQSRNEIEEQRDGLICSLLPLLKTYVTYCQLVLKVTLQKALIDYKSQNKSEGIDVETLKSFVEKIAHINKPFNSMSFLSAQLKRLQAVPPTVSANKLEDCHRCLNKLTSISSAFKTDSLETLIQSNKKYLDKQFNGTKTRIKEYQDSSLGFNQEYLLLPDRDCFLKSLIDKIEFIKQKYGVLKTIITRYCPLREQNSLSSAIKHLRTIQNSTITKELEYLGKIKKNAKEDIQKGFCPVCHKLCQFRCQKCKKIFYCSRAHQKEHWENHKIRCTDSADEPLYFIACNSILNNELELFDNRGNKINFICELQDEFSHFELDDRYYEFTIDQLNLRPVIKEHPTNLLYPLYFATDAAHKVLDDERVERLKRTTQNAIALSHLMYTLLPQKEDGEKECIT